MAVVVRLGHVQGRQVSLATVLATCPGYPPDYFELSFSVTLEDGDDGDTLSFWDGLATKPIISTVADRSQVLSVLMDTISLLVDEMRPRELHVCTHTADLPQKALRKFNRIAAHCGELGFRGGRTDPYHGRFIWMLAR
jgi:hypothetical protein